MIISYIVTIRALIIGFGIGILYNMENPKLEKLSLEDIKIIRESINIQLKKDSFNICNIRDINNLYGCYNKNIIKKMRMLHCHDYKYMDQSVLERLKKELYKPLL